MKELSEFLIGKYFFDKSEDRLFILLVQLLNEPHLFNSGFIFNNHLLWCPTVNVYYSINDHVKELSYTNSFTAGSTTGSAQWNGNISGMTWKSKSPTAPYSNTPVSAYAFQYDKVNRLTLAYYGSGANVSSWNDDPGKYNEAVSYDVMGNISTLLRNGVNNTIDNLSYTYGSTSNKLLAVTNSSSTPVGFNDGNKSGNDYDYDGNGNLTTDNNKGLAISYNYLNLPQSVSSSSQGTAITYTYDATGKKLKKSFPGQADHYYMDGIEYDGSTLLFAMTEEGRVRPKTNGTYTYDYFLKDHLGNIRVVLTTDNGQSAAIYPAATMETATASTETTYYSNLDKVRNFTPQGFERSNSYQNGTSLTIWIVYSINYKCAIY